MVIYSLFLILGVFRGLPKVLVIFSLTQSVWGVDWWPGIQCLYLESAAGLGLLYVVLPRRWARWGSLRMAAGLIDG